MGGPHTIPDVLLPSSHKQREIEITVCLLLFQCYFGFLFILCKGHVLRDVSNDRKQCVWDAAEHF